MQITIIGSGNPIPTLERRGTCLAVRVGDETLLIDCGPGTVEGLLEEHIHPGAIERVFFTHQHMDHNASFFHFVIGSWILGRRRLKVYGPEGTATLIDALEWVYARDFEYRTSLGRSTAGLTDIEYERLDDGSMVESSRWTATALAVDHSIETNAYRIEERATGNSMVFSGDTRQLPALADFAADTDVLIHDCSFGPVVDEIPDHPLIWNNQIAPDSHFRARLGAVHSNATEAAEIAADAGVKTLLLTHIPPFRDAAAIRTEATAAFDGRVIVARDGLTLASPF